MTGVALSMPAAGAVFTVDYPVPKTFGVVADGALFEDSPYLELPVTEVRLFWTLTVGPGFDAADIQANASVPVLIEGSGNVSFNLDSSNFGWAGTGTFNHTDTVDTPGMAFGPAWTFFSFSAIAPTFDGDYTVSQDSRIEVDFIVDLPGDTDQDGDIDDTDIGTMISNYTGPLAAGEGRVAFFEGDTDNDRDVDDSDVGTLIAGYTGPLAPTAVPEPATLGSLIGLVVLVRRRRN